MTEPFTRYELAAQLERAESEIAAGRERETALRHALVATCDAIAWMQDRIEPIGENEETKLIWTAGVEAAAREALRPEQQG